MVANSRGYLPVDAPRPGEPQVSLLQTARLLGRIVDGNLRVGSAEELPAEGEPPTVSANPPWTGGLGFRPSYCGEGGGQWIDCGDGNDSDPEARPTNVHYMPTSIEVEVDCSSLSDDDVQESGRRALDLLNVAQHGLIGAEFWRGDKAASAGLPNPSLVADAVDIGDGDTIPLLDALAGLDEALAGVGPAACGGGVRSMIHASPYLLNLWAGNGHIRRDGGLWLTPMDTIVVSGPGYDGSGEPNGYDAPHVDPTGETSWAYGTGIVDVRLGGPKELDYEIRDDNTITARVSRKFAVVWDLCCHLAVNVDQTRRD